MPQYENCHLVILSKYPESGNVKSRLAKSIGEEAAAKIMEALLVDLYSVHVNQNYGLSICAPISDKRFENNFLKLLPGALIEYVESTDLRGPHSQLYKIFKNKLKVHRKVVAITSDTPGIDEELVISTFNKLENVDVVIGPDSGTGYYLVGLKKEIDIFTDFPPKREPYLEKTLDLINKEKATYELIRSLPDLDFVTDISKINWNKVKWGWKRTIKVIRALGLWGRPN